MSNGSVGFLHALPDGVMLNGHDSWCQQLKLLLNLQPVPTRGHLNAIMKDRTKWVTL